MAAYRPMGVGGPAGGPGGMPGGVGGVGGAAGQVAGAGNPVIGGGGVAAGGVAGGAGGNAAGGAAGAGGATRNTNLSALQEIEEAYNKRLDMDVAQLMESFGDIIKTASITHSESLTQSKDKYKLAQESYQIQGRAANIVSSAESLLAMVTELKQTLLLNDTTTLAQLSTQRQQELSSQKTAVKQRVMGLKEEVDKTIWELEQACYGSSSSSIGVSTTEEAMV
ncbi:Mediator of RNA polymerase II transcription subunit 22 [Linnemannia elongata]|nr:Mediator of RNA polymerase II transcription subunit 22 [Linnemannia elongata]KAG0062261.1 Mediator of RNA polymerase II transcription subunit 22 [Linnemannia elongata]